MVIPGRAPRLGRWGAETGLLEHGTWKQGSVMMTTGPCETGVGCDCGIVWLVCVGGSETQKRIFLGLGRLRRAYATDVSVSEEPGELWKCWDWNCTQCRQREWLQLRMLAKQWASRRKEAPSTPHHCLPVLLYPSTASSQGASLRRRTLTCSVSRHSILGSESRGFGAKRRLPSNWPLDSQHPTHQERLLGFHTQPPGSGWPWTATADFSGILQVPESRLGLRVMWTPGCRLTRGRCWEHWWCPWQRPKQLRDMSSVSYTFCTFFGQKKHKDISDPKTGRRGAIIPLGKRSRNIWLISRQMD